MTAEYLLKKTDLSFIVKHFRVILCMGMTCLGSSVSIAQNIAFSFDDGLNPQTNHQAKQINQNILKHLKDAQVESMVFPTLIKIGDAQGKQLIRRWGEQGHLVGNHSTLHQNLNEDDVSSETYIQSIQDAETVLKDLPNWTKRYRYPFLKEGHTAQKRDAVKHWLQQYNYQSGAVSIDASDWFYNQKYLSYVKVNQPEKLTRLKDAYIEHLLDRAQYYDTLAQNTLGRSPDHILLLHVNAINAAFLADVIEAFKTKNWNIVSTQKAFRDPLYQMQTQYLPAGESIIWSLAKEKGLENLRYPAEDAPYEMDRLNHYQLD